MNDNVTISLISGISGVIIAYIVNVAAKKVQKSKMEAQPKDRMEQMFDGYERLIRQKDAEDDRKVKAIQSLEEELAYTRKTVLRLEKALQLTHKELEESREEVVQLKDMLEEMRKEYRLTKEDGVS